MKTKTSKRKRKKKKQQQPETDIFSINTQFNESVTFVFEFLYLNNHFNFSGRPLSQRAMREQRIMRQLCRWIPV